MNLQPFVKPYSETRKENLTSKIDFNDSQFSFEASYIQTIIVFIHYQSVYLEPYSNDWP